MYKLNYNNDRNREQLDIALGLFMNKKRIKKLKKIPKASSNFKTLLLQSTLFFIFALIFYSLQSPDDHGFTVIMQIICIILGIIWLFLALVNYYIIATSFKRVKYADDTLTLIIDEEYIMDCNVKYYWDNLLYCVTVKDIIVLIFKKSSIYIPFNDEHLKILKEVINDESCFYNMKNK